MPVQHVTLDVGMRVDIGKVLHVLAHEIRTPSGIAQGYVRMLLDERLSDPADRRRALEQTQKALARVSELTQESSQLANWLEADHPAASSIEARLMLDRVVTGAALEPALKVLSELAPPDVRVATVDEDALVESLVSVVKATARELRQGVCTLRARSYEPGICELLIGAAEQLPAVAAGPDAAGAGPLAIERGGLGLSLVFAAVVLDAHGATGWTVNGARTTVGIRLRLKERAHQ
jgi:signal transduction histidine kinase